MLLRVTGRFELRTRLQTWGAVEIALGKLVPTPDQRGVMNDEVFYLGFTSPLARLERRLSCLLARITPTFILERLGPRVPVYVSDHDNATDWVEENRGKLGSLG